MLLHKKQRARFPIIKRYVVYTKTAANPIKLEWFPSGVLQGHLAMLDVTLISSAEAKRASYGKGLSAPAVTNQTFQSGHAKQASSLHPSASSCHLWPAKKTHVRWKNSTQLSSLLTGPPPCPHLHTLDTRVPTTLNSLEPLLEHWGQLPGQLCWTEKRYKDAPAY